MILVRNSLGADLTGVVLSGVREKEDSDAPLRMGMIAPLLKNTTQVLVRPDPNRPIPPRVKVTFTQTYEGSRVFTLDLSDLLVQVTGSEYEALVVDIQPPGKVVCYLEEDVPFSASEAALRSNQKSLR